jgi:chromosome segregation ATPase
MSGGPEIPTTYSSLMPWIKDGGLVLLLLVMIFKEKLQSGKSAEKELSETEKSDKAKLKKDMEALEAAHTKFSAKAIETEVTQAHIKSEISTLSSGLKDVFNSINGILVAKAKEIAEFDTKIQEHERRLNKLEDKK